MMQNSTKVLMDRVGIKELFEIPHGNLHGSTVLASNGKEYLTVSQVLKLVEYIIKFIKDNFDMDEYKYSITISFLKSVQLVLNNGNAQKPAKEKTHIITDVMHEIADIHAQSDEEKEKNEEIAVAIKCLIDILE